ncbi:ComEC/Rec2 family competence protein [Zavarzinia sp.]|uniref:ComEC/Rec2 family competence protein n=1 Tax=Zavarzinia sp. TaxID=2027920 RepID=UPI0035612DC2
MAVSSVARLLLAERERWFLWLPFLVGAGDAAYLALAWEPSLAAALAPAVLLLCLLVATRAGGALGIGLIAALALTGGFAAAKLRAVAVGTPVIAERNGPVELQGTVVEREARPDQRPRAVLEDLAIGGLAGPPPRRIRLSFDPSVALEAIAPGARISVSAVLLPPPGPALPGAPDHGRAMWFDGIGAVGYADAAPVRLEGGAPDSLAAWRQRVADGLVAAMPAPEGAIAAALTVGLRGAVPAAVEDRWRAAGISHILSISGLHIGLAAGIVIFSLRFLLAAVPGISLRHPVKKWAAAVALLSAAAYTVVAGLDVPAQRSFIMTAIVLLAVLVDRLAVTLRLVAIAALAILLIEPESILSPGFGMSFASVAVLVAGYERVRPRLAGWRAGGGWLRRVLLALGGIFASSLLATLATAPFAIAHFGRLSLYGLAANLVAVPITGFVIMPAAVAAAVLAPLGAEGPALAALGLGIGWVDDLAAAIAAWPGAALAVPAMGQGALALFVLAGASLLLWRHWLRLTALPFALAAILAWWYRAEAPPLFLVHEDGKAVAAPVGERLVVLPPGTPRFMVEQWGEFLGLPETEALDRRQACRAKACRLTLADGRELVVAGGSAVPPCADFVVLPAAARPPDFACSGLVLDRPRLAGAGTLSVGVDGSVTSTTAGRGQRPWTAAYE